MVLHGQGTCMLKFPFMIFACIGINWTSLNKGVLVQTFCAGGTIKRGVRMDHVWVSNMGLTWSRTDLLWATIGRPQVRHCAAQHCLTVHQIWA